MESPKPIKRSEELAPLSREHHEGLLFVWKIRQGLKNETDINEIARFVQWFWSTELKRHFQREETILVPLLKDEPLLLRMMDEHQEIEALIHINEQIADEDLLVKLADTINDHIRFEERQLFPLVEQKLTPAQLTEAGSRLNVKPEACSPWPNAFWERKLNL
jgi:hemerythrin-like domain-containing protein